MTGTYRYLGRRLKDERMRQGITQAQLAETVRLSPQFVNDVEQGRRLLVPNDVYAVADALGLSRFDVLADMLVDKYGMDAMQAVSARLRTT